MMGSRSNKLELYMGFLSEFSSSLHSLSAVVGSSQVEMGQEWKQTALTG